LKDAAQLVELLRTLKKTGKERSLCSFHVHFEKTDDIEKLVKKIRSRSGIISLAAGGRLLAQDPAALPQPFRGGQDAAIALIDRPMPAVADLGKGSMPGRW